MQIGLEELWSGRIPKDADDFVELSDDIWKIGALNEIQEKVTPELFQLHIAMNLIGNWQSDGWAGIIENQPHLIPYVSEVLGAFELQNLQDAFNEMIAVFPKFITFKDDALYYDTLNFLQNIRFKVNDERLNRYTKEERQKIIKRYKEKLNHLEEMTEPLWGYESSKAGWALIFDYLYAKF